MRRSRWSALGLWATLHACTASVPPGFDGGLSDGGPNDASVSDAGETDAGGPDAGRPDAGSVRRFFSPDASWNTPNAVYGESTRYAAYADRFFQWAGGSDPATIGKLMPKFKAYSVPIYDLKTATTTARVFEAVWAQNWATLGNVAIGSTIPWNPAWKPGTENDRIMATVDESTGKVFEFWGVGEAKTACIDWFGPNAQAGYDANNPNHLCLAGLNTYENLWTATDGTTIVGRGMGINKLALVTRADEVLAGRIEHALELTITNSMFGEPLCNPPRGDSAPDAGVHCGFYLPPATRVEWTASTINRCAPTQTPPTSAYRSQTVPEGIRVALHVTDAEIEAWLSSRNYTGARRQTARVFAVALRDYGAIVAETGCWGVGIETDGVVNPTSAAKWAAAGIVDDGSANPAGDLLDGLVTRARLYVVEPPP